MINDERKSSDSATRCVGRGSIDRRSNIKSKPGLVDALDAGAHSDMDYALFLKSAKTLTPFEEMAQIAWHHAIDQELRERIAEIGRKRKRQC